MTRRGLVLGAGGVLGGAWMIGALAALEQEYGWDPREAEVLVGTSAGSVMAGLLASGVTVGQLLDHQRGVADPDGPQIAYDYDRDSGGALPPLPRLRMGSPRAAVSNALRPWRVTPMAALAAVLPEGRGSLEPIGEVIDAVHPGGGWTDHPKTWLVAMDYENGRRVPFGRAGSPAASLRQAVMASCAIPSWYAPVRIGGRRYVDGGTCSPTSVDLVAGLGLDEVVVLSPMTSLDYDTPRSVAARVERGVRRVVTRRLIGEVKKVAATGTRVTLLGPGREDLAGFGGNLMDPTRRARALETSLRTSAATLRRGGLRQVG